jgi:hypothetical protein
MPMPLGNATAAQVWFIVWCLECRYQAEPATASVRGLPSTLNFPIDARAHDARARVGTSGRRIRLSAGRSTG